MELGQMSLSLHTRYAILVKLLTLVKIIFFTNIGLDSSTPAMTTVVVGESGIDITYLGEKRMKQHSRGKK